MRLICAVGILASVVGIAAQSGEQAVMDADRQWQLAVQKADKTAVETLLDDQFTWTNAALGVRTKAKVLEQTAPPTTDADANVKVRVYGVLGVVTGTRHISQGSFDARIMRVWVNRHGTWKLLVQQGTPVDSNAGAAAPVVPATGTPDFSVPFTGRTSAEKEVVAALQALRKATSSHNADDFARLTADEFVVVPPDGHSQTKSQRIDTLKKQASGPVASPAKAQKVDVQVFGVAALTIAQELPPTPDAKPYRTTRVWVKRDGRWQQAINSMTTLPSTGKPTTR